MAEQDRLQLVGQSFANLADRESSRFASELGRVLAALERDLLGMVQDVKAGKRTALAKVGRLLLLRKEIRAALDSSGYSNLVTRAAIDVVDGMAGIAARSKIAEAGARLGKITPNRLKALAELFRQDLLGVGESMAHQVWRSSVLALYTNRPATEIVANLAKAIEKSRAQAQTLFDTQVSVIGREIVAAEETTADQAFLYVGPIDGKVRPFCMERVGKVYTRDAIDKMDNGSLPNVFITAGSYNCRHSWMAVSDPDLIAIANTNKLAPGFAEQIEAAKSARDYLKNRKAA